MAITGSGTQESPFIVHNYTEFISLSGHQPIDYTKAVYIQFFDTPGQVIDCNTYGLEFKWDAFEDSASTWGDVTYYIDLNGCTIKNFMIKAGVKMFEGHYIGMSGATGKIIISNGAILNVFMGSATSQVCGNYVEFHNVSISTNFSGNTEIPFNATTNGLLVFDNCALYLVGATLLAPVISCASISDTDIELHISNQNGIIPFGAPSGALSQALYCELSGCRIQGKISGVPCAHVEGGHYSVLGCATAYNDGDIGKICKLVNCVVDIDLSDSFVDESGIMYLIYKATGATDMNTNVLCKSLYPSGGGTMGYIYPDSWNYMTSAQIRNGQYLNDQGFTVVEVLGG